MSNNTPCLLNIATAVSLFLFFDFDVPGVTANRGAVHALVQFLRAQVLRVSKRLQGTDKLLTASVFDPDKQFSPIKITHNGLLDYVLFLQNKNILPYFQYHRIKFKMAY